MISQNANKIADGCRFCWMCRHICPTGIATGREEFTPRARGLTISMLNRGMKMDADLAESMFTCALCASCSNDCVTGYEPPVFIREGRTEAIIQDVIPDEVAPVIDRALAGRPIVEAVESEAHTKLLGKISALPKKAQTAIILGQTATNLVPETALHLLSILEKAGVEYTVISEDTGAMLYDLVGDVDEVRTAADAFSNAAAETGATQIVALDPLDARALIQFYPEWEINVDAKTETATSYLDKLIASGAVEISACDCDCTVTLQDPDVLARDLDDTETPRTLLAALGITPKEMFLNKRLSRSVGSVLLASYHDDITCEMTRIRIDDAVRTGADAIITVCPCDYALLTAQESKITVLDLFAMIDQAIV